MHSLPSLELIESTHTLPGRFLFKVIGEETANFSGRVLQAVRSRLPADAEPSFSIRKTSSGRHVCVSIEPEVDSAAHVLEIYQCLSSLEGLVLLL